MTEPTERVRVLVVGDGGVGKSSLVNLICHGVGLKYSNTTVGCNCDLKIHQSSVNGREYIAELLEIGSHFKNPQTVSVLLNNKQNVNGVIMVHDLSNRKSYLNLWRWLDVLDIYDSQPLADGDPFLVQGAAQHTVIVPSRRLMVPVLVVGTKSDLRPNADNATSVSADIATEYECLSMKMNTLVPLVDNQLIDRFLDNVVTAHDCKPFRLKRPLKLLEPCSQPDLETFRLMKSTIFGNRYYKWTMHLEYKLEADAQYKDTMKLLSIAFIFISLGTICFASKYKVIYLSGPHFRCFHPGKFGFEISPIGDTCDYSLLWDSESGRLFNSWNPVKFGDGDLSTGRAQKVNVVENKGSTPKWVLAVSNVAGKAEMIKAVDGYLMQIGSMCFGPRFVQSPIQKHEPVVRIIKVPCTDTLLKQPAFKF